MIGTYNTEPTTGLMLVEGGVLVCVGGKRFMVKQDKLVDLIPWSGMQAEDASKPEAKP